MSRIPGSFVMWSAIVFLIRCFTYTLNSYTIFYEPGKNIALVLDYTFIERHCMNKCILTMLDIDCIDVSL